MELDKYVVDIKKYFPSVISPAREFKSIAFIESAELNQIWSILQKEMLNTFVYDIDIDGARRWESMLSIFPLPDDTLEHRRRRILLKINSSLPYTEKSFQNMLDSAFGEGNVRLSLVYEKYELWLDIAPIVAFKIPKLRTFTRAIVPANLSIMVSNTKETSASITVAGIIQMAKIITISPDTSVSFHMTPATVDVAGIIQMAKNITIGDGR